VAGLLVNPGLEEVWLARGGGTWHPALDSGFAAAGLTSPAAGIPIGVPAAGVTGRQAHGCLSAVINGRPETYATWAEPQIGAQARRYGGFLLIVTHAVHPAQLDPEGLDRALASPLTLTGWAQLDSGRRTPWLLRGLRGPGAKVKIKEPNKEPTATAARPHPAPASHYRCS
jgi:hypothetical protein